MPRPTMTQNSIIEESIDKALSERYLAYALSTITMRALPDVRDGLKPVHRRILYAMGQLKLNSQSAHKKCARIVGDVMGQYHPHGDQSIYDALVKLSQTFSARYPLIDGQGNFGNIDGDGAAAMRYTEARMTPAGLALLEGLSEDAVDFKPTYNEEDQEPVVLPGGFPNLLANGSQGIAVGMATSVPPHNLNEICNAALHMIKSPNAHIETLLTHMPGPDFPTGGICVEPLESRLETYASGRGSFRVRARWHKESLGRGRWQIVVTEIPYQVQKSRLIEKLAEGIESRRLSGLADIRDESADTIRLILEPKNKALAADVLMESLFKATELETRLHLNMNVLDAAGRPYVMNLQTVLQAFLDHQRDVLQRRTRQRLDKIAVRLEVLEGLLLAYLNIDEVIEIIRFEDTPGTVLQTRLKLNERQAEAILNIRLRALHKLQEIEIKTENQALQSEQAALQALLASKSQQWTRISEQLKKLRSAYKTDKRRTDFTTPPAIEVDLDSVFIQNEPITVILSQKGWIRTLKGKLEEPESVKYKEGDSAAFIVPAMRTDKLILFASNGKFYTLAADKLPSGRGNGEPVRLMIDLENDHEPVGLFVHNPKRELVVASSDGYGFRVCEEDIIAMTRNGRRTLNVRADVEAVRCVQVKGDKIAVIGENRKLLVFDVQALPLMERGKGVRLQKYRDGGLADIVTFSSEQGLGFLDNSKRQQIVADWHLLQGQRAQVGRMAPRGFTRSGRFAPDRCL